MTGKPWAQMSTDEEVMAALAALWAASGWRRLEVSRGPRGYGGYCVPPAARPIETRDALRDPACPAVITRLAALLESSGWQRLEAIGIPLTGRVSGWCRRADGSGIKLTVGKTDQ